MKKSLFLVLVLSAYSLYAAPIELKLSTNIYDNTEEEFFSHESFVAMNVQDTDVQNLKTQIEAALKVKLSHPDGDANIQVVTEQEYNEALKAKLTIDELDKIADRYDIQKARLNILGVGSVDNNEFFLIVDSEELRTIRQMIHYEFVRRGGKRDAFDPTWFFPNIFIGSVEKKTINKEILKNLKFSSDARFNLKFVFGSK